ncbi:MAG: glycosyltransferase [Planctomycetaceae bacterium]
MSPQNIGFISTRLSGTDGVSLESSKWAEVLWHHEHVSYWYAGKLDRAPEISMEVPEAFFRHPENVEIDRQSFGTLQRPADLTSRINDLAEFLKRTLYDFVEKFNINVLIAQNSLCIPMHIPLGVALTHFIAETEFPVIAHHHDFYWERDRFSVNSVADFLQMAFPPNLPTVQHATINTAARLDLAHRKGCASILVPNVLNFEEPPPPPDRYAADFREQIGIAQDDVLVLQPTRVVPRKGIEMAINLLAAIGDKRLKLVVTHESGDEGLDYHNALVFMAEKSGVDLRFVHARVGDERGFDADGNKVYSLEDVYPHADLVTYFSWYEGFGNALLEAFYFRKPVILNRYSNFVTDIEPKGFKVITTNGILTDRVVSRVTELMNDPAARQEMVDRNHELARLFFSYSVLRRKLRALICNVTGADDL